MKSASRILDSNLMGSKKDFLMYALIGIVAFCAFANTFGHGFVYDDNRQILRNPLIQRSELYGKALTSDVWAFKGGGDIAASNYFRPTFVAWMIINWKRFGASPAGWHVTGVLLHVLACLLLFGFLRRFGCEEITAAIIALLFAVHPVHVENVAWISGVTDALMSVFLFASLILAQSYATVRLAKSSSSRATTLLVVSIALYLLAIGAKEIALFCVPLYWLIFRDPRDKNSNYDAVKPTLPYLVVAVGFFIARIRVLGALFLPVEDPVQGSSAFLVIPKIFMFYVRQMFFPIWLGPALPIRPVGFTFVDVVLPLLLSAAILWGLWILARRSEIQMFGLALFLLTLLPLMNPGNFGTEHLVHDRYLYLPLAGILLIVIPEITRFFAEREIAGGRKLLALAFAAIVLVLGAKTVIYNRAWSSDETLWRYAVTIDPGSAHAWIQFGSATANASESLNAFERSLQIKRTGVGLVSKSRALLALGRLEDSIAPAREAIAFDPTLINAYSLFQAYEVETLALANLGRYAEAENSLKAGRQRLPIYYAALTEKLSVLLYNQNRKPEALAELEAVRDRARSEYLNESKDVFLRLGMLYAELGKKREAKSALEEYLTTTTDVQDTASVEERRSASQLLWQVSSP